MSADPFGTEQIRAAVLHSWFASPERFREDANAESELRAGGYRDRLLVELAANASDAALAAGAEGRLTVYAAEGELRAANTGVALDAPGVRSLASLRASAKRDGTSVGHFGVGFAAVLAVTDEPEIVSTSGGVRFSTERTRDAVRSAAGPGRELLRRRGEVPVLRLPWPASGRPRDGFDTEVRLPLRDGVDAADVLDAAAAQAGDLLLALPGLREITVADRVFERTAEGRTVTIGGPGGSGRWYCRRASGTLRPAQLAGLGAEAAERAAFSVCWAVPVDGAGVPLPHEEDVLHAPTPTDERLSVPARLFATVPLESGRRRLLPGAASTAVLHAAASGYPALLAGLPGPARPHLLPEPGFPRSDVDAAVRDALTTALLGAAWVPTASGVDVTPAAACVLDGATPELVELLADVVPGLAVAEFSARGHAPALNALGVRRMGWAGLADALTGLGRAPAWWRRLYAALEAAGADTAELGALPVPLADGRTMPGARGAQLPSALVENLPGDPHVPGLRLVHPDASHRLLERLGARRAGAADLLDTGEIAAAVLRSLDDAVAGIDPGPLTTFVLGLLRATGAERASRPWLGSLVLRDERNRYRRAEDLLLPDAALREVLDPAVLAEGGPLGVLDAEELATHGRDVLVAAGVLDGFAVVLDEEPSGPDHDLESEPDWWALTFGDGPPPARVLAVRDLDLVADECWERALELLASDPRTWQALAERDGYTAWYVSHCAPLSGQTPRRWRLASATGLAGLYDPVPPTALPERVLAAAGVRGSLVLTDAEDVDDLLDRLADEKRDVPRALALRAHTAAVAAAHSGHPAMDGLRHTEPPTRVRTLDGAVAAAGDVAVLDVPWALGLLPGDRLVAASGGDAAGLAALLDVSLASDETAAVPESDGEPVDWSGLPAVREACALLDLDVPEGTVTVHELLVVRGAPVPWWVAGGAVHAADTTEGLARALAWTSGHWRDRHLIAALLDDPTPAVLLG